MPKSTRAPFVLVVVSTFLILASPAFAQSDVEIGTLKVHVRPKQAYIFIDGKAVGDGSRTIELPGGNHTVAVRNYGCAPNIQSVNVPAGVTTHLNVSLQAAGDKVSGPFGEIELKGRPRAAVLLNGQTPSNFVGHVDEFDWNWIWHQRLLVKPGTYQVTAKREGNTIWSGPVSVKAGQRVVVYLDENGKTKIRDWGEGLTMEPQARFRAGIANTTVAVAPVTAQLSTQQSRLDCGQSTGLKWGSTDAVDTSISGIGRVPQRGDRDVTPTGTTTYVLTAKGPGGESSRKVTVVVNTQPAAMLAVSRPEVRYHQIGDKVVEQDSAVLKWSVSNANSARLDPLGEHIMSGSRSIAPRPAGTQSGPVDQYLNYTLTASNACGGSTTKTATLHLVGSIDPPPALTLASVFYPTAYPTRTRPASGLLAGERKTLMQLASHFKDRHEYEQKASLVIVGHADVRGSRKYNEALSQRRAELVKSLLVSQGIPANEIQVRAEGKDHQLDHATVATLQSHDPQKPEKWMMHHTRTTWLAYNRRADILLQPKGQRSTEMYPNDRPDAHLLWQRPEPSLKRVELAGKSPVARASSQANTTGD